MEVVVGWILISRQHRKGSVFLTSRRHDFLRALGARHRRRPKRSSQRFCRHFCREVMLGRILRASHGASNLSASLSDRCDGGIRADVSRVLSTPGFPYSNFQWGVPMSERDIDLLEDDVEEDLDFPPTNRRIVTQPYDLSLQTLVEQWDSNHLVLPELQREYVWDNGRASRLIESFILNIPVPPIYFAERPDSVLEIIDGHQRVKSIVRFMKNEFSLRSLSVLSDTGGSGFTNFRNESNASYRIDPSVPW